MPTDDLDSESPATSRVALVALDWGTTSLRAYLVGDDGSTLDARESPLGVMAVRAGGQPGDSVPDRYEQALGSICGDWLRDHPGVPILACGMVGSNQGWASADYLTVPISILESKLPLTAVATRFGPVHIVPGLIDKGPIPDVMRGEETQILGAVLAAQDGTGTHPGTTRLVVLPGTHSKWARLSGTEIVAFTTFLTGELFALLTEHSILGRSAVRSDAVDWDAFDLGVLVANRQRTKGLSGMLFSARSLTVTGKLASSGINDYLSGLLIGCEIQGVQSWWGESDQPILLCGSPRLCQRYARALESIDRTSVCIAPSITAQSLHYIATNAGLLPRTHEPEEEDHA